MPVMDVLKRVKRERLAAPHLLKDEDISLRFPYIVGVAMVTQADGEVTIEKKSFLEDISRAVGLSDEQLSQALDAIIEAENNPGIITTIVDEIEKHDQKYAFILDLYRAGWTAGSIGPVTRQMISEFAEMLKISASEQKCLQEFAAAILDDDSAKVAAIVNSVGAAGSILPVKVLNYFLSGVEFQRTEQLQGERLFYQGLFKESLQIFERVARNNNPRAMYFYGTILQEGLGGITKDKEIAQANFRQGAILEDPFCQYETAIMMRAEDPENASLMLLAACKDLLYLAKNDDKEAQWIVGQIFSCDFVIKKDEATSCRWFRKAAMQGYFRAQNSLGNSYSLGKWVRQDLAEAEKWYRKAAEQGYALAQDMLGDCYRYGLGVAMDKSEAIKWYCKAAAQGNEDSQESLKELCLTYV